MFPGMGAGTNSWRMARYENRAAATPSGALIYHPPGAPAETPGQLIVEFSREVLLTLGAVLLLARTRIRGCSGRVGFVAAVGAIAAAGTSWYGFPASYTVSAFAIELAGFLIAGLIAAALAPSTTGRL